MNEKELNNFGRFLELARTLPEPAQNLLMVYGQGLADMAEMYRPELPQPPQAARPGA